MSADYKSTIALPVTDFAMKARLPVREPEMLQRWQDMDLFGRLRTEAAGRPRFVLHDGPPYANGDIHIGTAMNKILKDIVVRSRQMTGFDAPYVPGWDCHGLPIEWKIEEQYRKAGRDKDAAPVNEFRAECRQFAARWIDVQRGQFQRLGGIGDWARPYTTMAFDAEAKIVTELMHFLMDGSLYKGSKAVMWSVVEKTALAEAEIEYHDHKSTTVDIAFPVISSPLPALRGAAAVIWTTTPWTMPGNRAVAYGEDIDYLLVEVERLGEDSLVATGRRLIVAETLMTAFAERAGIESWHQVARFTGRQLEGTVCAHPWRGKGYDFDVPLLPGFHVTTEAGTGLVHTAPGHGAEDYEIGQQFGLEVPFTVAPDGTYYDNVPLLGGQHVYKVADTVCAEMSAVGALLARGEMIHSYPHSWRSKAPLIFRNAPQWFIGMEKTGLRQKALAAIDTVRWLPAVSRNRIRAMVEDRPDWVISRQRAWGVPITIFENRQSGELLRDEAVNARIVAAVREGGADVWFDDDKSRFLGPDYEPDEWTAVTDILDVWFDSGCTHSFVLEDRAELAWPADLYLEGSDQHRGWFQSSLLEACGSRGKAPYKAVMTHGFVMDAHGRKMSKSIGNVIAPQKIIDRNGADILRLWVVATDYSEDVRISDEIIRAQVDSYRKLRNTLRFLLGNLAGFSDVERLDAEQMPELERWVLHRLAEMDTLVRQAVEEYDFHRLFAALYTFCTGDLSAFYFDIRKDCLYCDGRDSTRRRAARTVLAQVFDCLVTWLAPILCFTAEEAWLARGGEVGGSVHLCQFPAIPAAWKDPELCQKWTRIRALRRVITGALEVERREKRIGSSLAASPTVYVAEAADRAVLESIDGAEMAITSGIDIVGDRPPAAAFRLDDVPGIAVVSAPAQGDKCARCWRILPEVGSADSGPTICHRCAAVVGADC